MYFYVKKVDKDQILLQEKIKQVMGQEVNNATIILKIK